jgi:hypothetical protein
MRLSTKDQDAIGNLYTEGLKWDIPDNYHDDDYHSPDDNNQETYDNIKGDAQNQISQTLEFITKLIERFQNDRNINNLIGGLEYSLSSVLKPYQSKYKSKYNS